MTENKHTPGPWSWNTDYNEDNVFSVWVEAPDVTHKTTNICVADCSWVELLEEAEANAALIAAAPDMYEVLEDLLKYKGVMSDESTERANAAIAKARGEE